MDDWYVHIEVGICDTIKLGILTRLGLSCQFFSFFGLVRVRVTRSCDTNKFGTYTCEQVM